MKKLLLFSFLLAGTLSSQAQQTNETITVDGIVRDYILYRPTGFDPQTETLPLVFVLHGLGGNHTQMVNVGFNQIADTARFLVIYPLGKMNSFSQNAWNNGTLAGSNVDDVALVSLLIDKTNSDYGVDLTRVYSCGLSMGGIMSHRLAIMLNDRIAAIASMVGTMSTTDKNSGTPARPVPVMHWHGTNDATVPYDGSPLPSLELVQPTIDFWKDANKCGESDSTIIVMPDLSPTDGATVERIIYHASASGCDSAALEQWKFTGGTHTWFYRPLNDVDGAQEFWKFFYNKSHATAPPAGQSEYKKIKFSVFPNPSNGEIRVQSEEKITLVKIFDGLGKLIYESTENESTFELDVDLAPGIYTLAIFAGEHYNSQPIVIQK